jgi:hypothetical protein
LLIFVQLVVLVGCTMLMPLGIFGFVCDASQAIILVACGNSWAMNGAGGFPAGHVAVLGGHDVDASLEEEGENGKEDMLYCTC